MQRNLSATDMLAAIITSREASTRELIHRANLIVTYAIAYVSKEDRTALRSAVKGDAVGAIGAIFSAVDAGAGPEHSAVLASILLKGKVSLATIAKAISAESAESADETLPA